MTSETISHSRQGAGTDLQQKHGGFSSPRHPCTSPSSKGSPHSGQNLGGWAGSSGSQPHLSHLYWGTPAGFFRPALRAEFPLVYRAAGTNPAVCGRFGLAALRAEFSNDTAFSAGSRSNRRKQRTQEPQKMQVEPVAVHPFDRGSGHSCRPSVQPSPFP